MSSSATSPITNGNNASRIHGARQQIPPCSRTSTASSRCATVVRPVARTSNRHKAALAGPLRVGSADLPVVGSADPVAEAAHPVLQGEAAAEDLQVVEAVVEAAEVANRDK